MTSECSTLLTAVAVICTLLGLIVGGGMVLLVTWLRDREDRR